jgi:DnaJ-class molecular chaperone
MWGMGFNLVDAGDQYPDTNKIGDLNIVLSEVVGYNPSNLKRNNHNLHIDVELSLQEALCGFELVICQLDKRKLIINHDLKQKVIQPGETMKIVGEGMPILGSTQKGDLIIHFTVVLPKLLDPKRKEILNQVLPNIKRNNPVVNEDDIKDNKNLVEVDGKDHNNHSKSTERESMRFGGEEFPDILNDEGQNSQPGVQCAQQ